MARMKSAVVPTLASVFEEHDAVKFGGGKFTCTTCHGPNYVAPQQFLPKLKLSDGGYAKLSAEKPEIVKWMQHVEPKMAAAMGEEHYDAKTNTGFGCKGCHSVE